MHFWSYYVNWNNRLMHGCGTYEVHVNSLQELYKVMKTNICIIQMTTKLDTIHTKLNLMVVIFINIGVTKRPL